MRSIKHDNKETILEFFATDADMLPIVESMQEPCLYLYVYDETVVNYIVCERYENEGNFVETEAGTAEECREFLGKDFTDVELFK